MKLVQIKEVKSFGIVFRETTVRLVTEQVMDWPIWDHPNKQMRTVVKGRLLRGNQRMSTLLLQGAQQILNFTKYIQKGLFVLGIIFNEAS